MFFPSWGHMADLDRSPPQSALAPTSPIAHSAAIPPQVIPVKHVRHMAPTLPHSTLHHTNSVAYSATIPPCLTPRATCAVLPVICRDSYVILPRFCRVV